MAKVLLVRCASAPASNQVEGVSNKPARKLTGTAAMIGNNLRSLDLLRGSPPFAWFHAWAAGKAVFYRTHLLSAREPTGYWTRTAEKKPKAGGSTRPLSQKSRHPQRSSDWSSLSFGSRLARIFWFPGVITQINISTLGEKFIRGAQVWPALTVGV